MNNFNQFNILLQLNGYRSGDSLDSMLNLLLIFNIDCGPWDQSHKARNDMAQHVLVDLYQIRSSTT